MADSTQEKTEAPTQKRRNEARQDGNVARSTDLNAAVVLLAAIVLLYALGMRLLVGLTQMLQITLGGMQSGNVTRPDDMWVMVNGSLHSAFGALMPLMLGVMAVGLLVSIGQVGFLLTGKPLVPKFSKLNPWKGLKNLFSPRAGMRLLMSLAKLAIIAGLAFYTIESDMPILLRLSELEVAQAFFKAAWLVFDLAIKLALLLLVLALIDFVYQRWQNEQSMKMTKQEVKEEMKSMEGDPLVKQRRARVARQLAMQRIAANVPKADVIVTNPTHFAVALSYDRETMRVPKVVAKGADFLAFRIRQIGALHEIPIVERKPLARALYYGVEIGQEIPAEHYTAVAEILAYVYRLNTRKVA